MKENAGLGSRRNWAAVQSQQKPKPTPQGTPELGCPLRAVPSGDKKSGSEGKRPFSPGGRSREHDAQFKRDQCVHQLQLPSEL